MTQSVSHPSSRPSSMTGVISLLCPMGYVPSTRLDSEVKQPTAVHGPREKKKRMKRSGLSLGGEAVKQGWIGGEEEGIGKREYDWEWRVWMGLLCSLRQNKEKGKRLCYFFIKYLTHKTLIYGPHLEHLSYSINLINV
jgi:hypothetical protein